MTATQTEYVVCTDQGLYWCGNTIGKSADSAQRFPDQKSARSMRDDLNRALGKGRGSSWKVSPAPEVIPAASNGNAYYSPSDFIYEDEPPEPPPRVFKVRCPCCRHRLTLTVKPKKNSRMI